MQTTNNALKTENQKFGNPLSKTFAVILSLVLISLTVSANGFWKQLLVNNTYGKMATLMVTEANKNEELLTGAAPAIIVHSTEAISSINAFVIEPAKEKMQGIESWMTDETYFGTKLLTDQISEEKSLKIEDWMTANPYFTEPVITTDSEPALELEYWMMDDTIWNN